MALLSFALCLTPTRADLYWCQVDDISSALVQAPLEGKECRLVEKSPPPPKSSSKQTPSQSSSAPSGEATEKLSSFPRIWPQEQKKRDQVRQSILYRELEVEMNKRDLIYGQLNNANFDGDAKARNYYKRRLNNHMLNIKALRQEIARTQ